jgi:hypothetical protein
MWRVDAVRRELELYTVESIQADAAYRLFGRLGVGGNYSWSRSAGDVIALSLPKHVANAWLNVELPVRTTHSVSATVVQRYHDYNEDIDSLFSTDAALRYTVPVRRVAVTVAGDVENLFNASRRAGQQPRTFRFWVRVGL